MSLTSFTLSYSSPESTIFTKSPQFRISQGASTINPGPTSPCRTYVSTCSAFSKRIASSLAWGDQRNQNLRSDRYQVVPRLGTLGMRMGHVCGGSEGSTGTVIENSEFYGEMDAIVEVAHKLADAARVITLKYFRSRLQIIDKTDLSPVTIADRAAEEAMRALLAEHFPSHAIYGEEWGLTMPERGSDYVWVLDPIDGTKSFITGKPVFGTLIALMHRGIPILGIIDQPVLQERWLGIQGRVTTLNGVQIQTRSATTLLKDAYLYTTSPHLFAGEAEDAFTRVRNKVKVPLYGCDCYAYGLLAAGHVDLVIESGLKPYDYLALVPVVEGAGGVMTDWEGQKLRWLPEIGEVGIEVVAAGSESLHKAALSLLARNGQNTSS